MYNDAPLQEGRTNNVVNVRTFPYLLSCASNTAPLPPYLPKACVLSNEFLIPVVYPQSETAFQNNFFSNTDHLELNLKEMSSSALSLALWSSSFFRHSTF